MEHAFKRASQIPVPATIDTETTKQNQHLTDINLSPGSGAKLSQLAVLAAPSVDADDRRTAIAGMLAGYAVTDAGHSHASRLRDGLAATCAVFGAGTGRHSRPSDRQRVAMLSSI